MSSPKRSPPPSTTMPSTSSPSSPAESNVSSPPSPHPQTAKTNGTRARSTASKATPSTASPPSNGLATRVIFSFIIIILALSLAHVAIPSFSPLDLFKSTTNTHHHTSSHSSSHSSSSTPTQARHSGEGKKGFGTPMSDTIPSSAPMFLRHQAAKAQAQAQQDRQQRQQQRRQQHSSPFDDFFGGGSAQQQDDSEDDSEEFPSSDASACKGYYCEETQVCVDRPVQCPCPYDTDTKCLRGEWYVCYRGPNKC
ncbi:hypothetical protein K457DRAFT_34653 [Linnemannia elongata AG-77]|uniref:Long chronological lifespan protein 2 n=1 Tax=Linnemannia elongata AG-77 TaxID=1314771 RepID=A0A197JPE4_9FUNG|nr:hypothetical protein K457DRAFT_34653 [Linnemannia elongata AG-77]